MSAAPLGALGPGRGASTGASGLPGLLKASCPQPHQCWQEVPPAKSFSKPLKADGVEEGANSTLSSYSITDTALDLETRHLVSDTGSSTPSAGDLTQSPHLTESQFPHLVNGDCDGL